METLNLERIKSLFLDRVVLNIYFWLCFVLIPILISLGEHEHDKPNIRSLILFALYYASIVYFNNLILVPFLFYKKKYWQHLLIIIPLIILWATIQVEFHNIFYGCHCIIYINTENVATATFQVGAIVFIFAAIKIVRDYLKNEEEYKEKEQIRLENEVSLLKGQINPHFLFNTLNSLYSYALEESPKVPDFVLKLSEMLRYMLYECNESFVSLEKEVNYLKNYIDLQEIRMEGRGEVKLIIEGNLNEYKIAPALLINFVENCFKHTLDSYINHIKVMVNIHVTNGELLFITENNKTEEGSIKNGLEKGNGIGLKNVKKRLDIIYPKRYSLDIISGESTYKSELKIDLVA